MFGEGMRQKSNVGRGMPKKINVWGGGRREKMCGDGLAKFPQDLKCRIALKCCK